MNFLLYLKINLLYEPFVLMLPILNLNSQFKSYFYLKLIRAVTI